MQIPLKSGPLRFLPWLVLLLSLAVTYQLWKNAQLEPERDLRNNFNYRVLEIVNRLDERILSYEQVLAGVQALFTSTGNVGRDEFRSYIGALHLDRNFPGIHGVTLILTSPADSAASGREDRFSGLSYIEQFPGRNKLAFGYDVFARPELRAVMERTLNTGQVAVTGKLEMAPASDGYQKSGFLMYVPLYKQGGAHDTLAERRANLIGWAAAAFRMNELMFGILGDSASDLDVEIFDGEDLSEKTLLYDPDYSHYDGGRKGAWLKSIVRIEVLGHTWTMAISSLPDFEARLDKVKAELIAETGVGISILLALLTWLLVRGRARALQAADELEMRVQGRTHDLAATATQLEQEIQARKQLERSILEISEEEQARIGRELHDDLGQLLTGAAYLAGALSSSLARTDQGSSQQAGEIKKIMQDAIKRTRYISHGLIPFNIASQGLQQGLAQLANDVATLSGIPCEVSFSGSTEVSDSMIATHLYRIAQEAINNAVKHSSAHQLSIALSANADEIRLTIADDGVGLPEQLQGASAGVGLMNMKYRAQIIGASITLEAQKGKGTRVLLVLPLGNS